MAKIIPTIQPKPMSAEKQAMLDNLDMLNGINNQNGTYNYGTSGSLAYGNSDGSGLAQTINDKLNKGEDITGLTQQYAQGAQAYTDNQNKNKAMLANPLGSSQDYINQLKEQQKQAQLASLGKARDSSLSNLNAEKAQIQPLYYNKRNETSTGSQLQAKNFAEFMAQRGQSNAGASGQAELSRNVALQGNIGQLNTQEANAFTENSRRITDTNNAYESDVASANAGIEAQAMQNLMDFYRENLSREQNQSNIDRSFDYQAVRDRASDNKYNQQWDYNVGRDTVEDNRYEQNYQQQLEQQKIDNIYRKEQSDIDNLYRQGQMTLSERGQALNESQLKFQQEQQKLDNIFRDKQLSADTTYKNASLNKSSSSSSGSSSINKTEAKTQLFQEVTNYIKSGEYERANEILTQDKAAIIATFGQTAYNQLYKMFWDSQAY